MIQQQNQLHNPQPKKKRVDAQGNSRRKMFYKDGTATILFCEGLTKAGIEAFSKFIDEKARQLGTRVKGHFISTM